MKLSFSLLKGSSMAWFDIRRPIQTPAVSRKIYPAIVVRVYREPIRGIGSEKDKMIPLAPKSMVPTPREV